MSDSEKVRELENRLSDLIIRQNNLIRDIKSFRSEMEDFKSRSVQKEEKVVVQESIVQQTPRLETKIQKATTSQMPKPKERSDIERFIGENLISKVGILVTVIGVFIGTKYAIDHNIIGPITRILLGYAFGLGLLVISLRLKKKYENFSSVLLSGAMAILYFITFSAYYFFALIPLTLTFGIMVVITIATVYWALNLDRVFIAHLGLVGAYAIPFLLGNESDNNPVVLFSHIFLINAGILVLAWKKAWKSLYQNAFYATWLIFLFWYWFDSPNNFPRVAVSFSTAFYVMFYTMTLIQKDQGKLFGSDLLNLFTNSLIFLGISYGEFEGELSYLLPWVILVQGLLHLSVWAIIRFKRPDASLRPVLYGLGVLFISLFLFELIDGKVLTLFWLGQALILFRVSGKTEGKFGVWLSMVVLALSFISLMSNWSEFYPYLETSWFLINIRFGTSLAFIVGLWLLTRWALKSEITVQFSFIRLALPAILLLVIFLSIRLEITSYWAYRFYEMTQEGMLMNRFLPGNLESFWLIIYYLLFAAVFAFVSHGFFKNELLDYLGAIGLVISVLLFLIAGYIAIDAIQNEGSSFIVPWVRPIGYLALAIALLSMRKATLVAKERLSVFKELFFSGTLIWVLTKETLYWSEVLDISTPEKFTISILWGVFALLFVVIGIWKKKSEFRISGFIIFGITLLKMFFYDTSGMDTIRKTGLFVIIGLILLIVSYLYNRFRGKMFGEDHGE